MSKQNPLARILLRLPLVWGVLTALAFYALIHRGVLSGEFVQRYFASHPVEYLSMTMFFVGLAALAMKAIDVAGQQARLSAPSLGAAPAGGEPVENVGELITRLDESSARQRGSYLVRRLAEALQYVRRKGSADQLDEHLRYASDIDAARMHASYSLVRIIIWAIPILGFLGTVIGITLAIAKLGSQDLENSLPAVVSGLKIAFDTTALALALSIILMFAQFIVDRFETRLLGSVDERVAEELVGRFQDYGSASDPQAAAVRRMADSVIDACGRLVERQTELWTKSMEAAQAGWTDSGKQAQQSLEAGLTKALDATMAKHASALKSAETEAAERAGKHAAAMQESLAEQTAQIAKYQDKLAQQAEVLAGVVRATDQVTRLETALNNNLETLAGERRFEQAVLSLTAAIQLLSAQLNSKPQDSQRVELRSPLRAAG